MCYDVKTSLEAQLKRAKRNQDLKAIDEIIEKLGPLTDLPLHHASGFSQRRTAKEDLEQYVECQGRDHY